MRSDFPLCALLCAAVASAIPADTIPGGKKAGMAGSRAVPFMKEHLGWWYDWSSTPGTVGGIPGVTMLWGDGTNGKLDAQRFSAFQKLTTAPQYLLGFNEPDCTGADISADMTVDEGVSTWNQYIAPKGKQGSLLGSPSMCHQKDEKWLQQFKSKQPARDWDFTAIHVNKQDMAGVQADIDYYWKTYQKPIWVTEFACVNDVNGFTPCDDQAKINQFIKDAVDLFQNSQHVRAYAYSSGLGLGTKWPPTTSDGTALSESGRTYLTAISKYS